MFLTGYAIGPASGARGWPSRWTGRRPPAPAAIARAGRHRAALRLSGARRGRPGLQRRPAARPGRPPARQPPQDPSVRRPRPQRLRAGPGPADLAELDGIEARHPDLLRRRVPGERPALALAGAELVAVPTANMVPFAFVVPLAGARSGPTRTTCSSPTSTAAAARASSSISGCPASSAPTGSTSPAPAPARS